MDEAERKRLKVEARKRWRHANPEKQRVIAREASRRRRAKFPSESNEYSRRYYRANLDKARAASRNQHYKSSYGITLVQRDELLAAQGGVCGSCGRGKDTGTRWHTDHNHGTGVIRGILCHHCNLALGHARDDVDTLFKLIEYLRKHR